MPILNTISGNFGVFSRIIKLKPTSFRYFIFDPISVKTPGNYIQLSEFNLMNSGTRITSATYGNWDNSFTPGSSIGDANSPGGETPGLANDGNAGSKWLDFRESAGGLYIDLGSIIQTTGYQIYTANDGPNRDPYTWNVYGSVNGSTWYLISSVVNYYGTDSRFSFYGSWDWNFSLS